MLVPVGRPMRSNADLLRPAVPSSVSELLVDNVEVRVIRVGIRGG